MITNPIIFYIASAILIIFTIMTLIIKDLIRALLSAVIVFFSAAIIFYLLGSEYNAIIQAAIYGLAVPIIIGISIMFTGGTQRKEHKKFTIPYLAVFFAGIFVLAFTYLMMISLTINPETFHKMNLAQTNFYEIITAFSHGIFVNYVWAFELVSLLLTIVIAGISLFRKRGA